MVAHSDEMTGLDTALADLRLDQENGKLQSQFYDLFLNSTFYVPSLDANKMAPDAPPLEDGQVLPMIMESDGDDYLMLFDTKERLQAWADPDTCWVEVPGYVLAATSMPPLHWALNVGTDYSKQFHPDEIAWLREVVERCNAAATETAPQ